MSAPGYCTTRMNNSDTEKTEKNASYDGDFGFYSWNCPDCGKNVTNKPNFCPHCGLKLTYNRTNNLRQL